MNDIIYQFINSVVEMANNSFDEMNVRMLCDYCEYAPYCYSGGQNDCSEGIYKYLIEED